MFSGLLQRINEDIALSSPETCTEIRSHQTIKITFDKGQANHPGGGGGGGGTSLGC